MQIGLLWYDPDPKRPVAAKIDAAAARYAERFGVAPNTCHVNPTEMTKHPRLEIVPDRWVQPSHFWVGVDEELAIAKTPAPKRRSA